jgi:hypothetical protein
MIDSDSDVTRPNPTPDHTCSTQPAGASDDTAPRRIVAHVRYADGKRECAYTGMVEESGDGRAIVLYDLGCCAEVGRFSLLPGEEPGAACNAFGREVGGAAQVVRIAWGNASVVEDDSCCRVSLPAVRESIASA